MISFTYASSAREMFSTDQLTSLLVKARENNARLGITGMLLYKDGNFMQTMEGPEEAVHALYKKILADTRHTHIFKLLSNDIHERSFSHWEMGFCNLEAINADDLPGYSEFLQKPLNSVFFQTNPTDAQKLLLTFRKTMR